MSHPVAGAGSATRWDLLMLAVAAMILTYVWRIQDLYGIFGLIRLPILALGGALFLFVADSDRRRRVIGVKHPVMICAMAILAIMVLGVPTSLYPGQSFGFIRDDFIKTFILMVLVATTIRSFADVERYAAILVGGAGLYAWFVLTRFHVGVGGRLGNLLYYDANDVALLLVATLPIAIYFLNRTRNAGVRVLLLIVLGMFIMGIVRSGSRGGFLGLIAVVTYLLFGFNAIPKRVRIFSVAASLLLLSVVASDKYWEMMSTLLEPQKDYNWSNDEGTGRTEIWKRGVGYMVTHPVFGVGARSFPVAEGTLSARAKERISLNKGVAWRAAHNSFVELGAELGMFALAAFVAMLFYAYRTARGGGRLNGPRAPPARGRAVSPELALGHALAGAVVGYCVSGFFLSQAYSAYLYTLLGIIVGLWKVANQGGETSAPAPQLHRRRRVPNRMNRRAARERGYATVPRTRSA